LIVSDYCPKCREPSRERLELAFSTLSRYFTELNTSIDAQAARAGSLVTISAFIVTFASAAGLIGKGTTVDFPRWASVSLWGIIVVQVLAVMYILWPRRYKRGPDVRRMMEEDTDPWLTEARIKELRDRLNSNGEAYHRCGYVYQFALVCLVAEVTVILWAIVTSG
jgi:uncharacterized protein (DUF983 family)